MSDWIILAASALVVAFMVIVAAALGFRERATLTDERLARLAADTGAQVEASAISADASAALARLSDGKLLVARIAGDGVGARVTPVQATRIRINKDRVSVALDDLGFPPLRLKLKEAPPRWLTQLVRG